MIELVWLQYNLILFLPLALHQQRQEDTRHNYTAHCRCFGRNNLSLSVRSFYFFFITSITLFLIFLWGTPGTTYPLDLVRSRLSIATASIPVQHSTPSTVSTQQPSLSSGYHTASAPSSATLARTTKHAAWTPKDLTMWGMTLKVMREEGGVRALYRGMIPTAVGVAPYVGINFAAYETLRGIITPPDKSTIVRKLTCGALAGESVSKN